MRRGEIRTVAGGPDCAGKPRPTVIVQDDAFDATQSITICSFTTDPTEAPLFRIFVESNAQNGLRIPSRPMVDKQTTVRKAKLGARIGRLDQEDIVRLNQPKAPRACRARVRPLDLDPRDQRQRPDGSTDHQGGRTERH